MQAARWSKGLIATGIVAGATALLLSALFAMSRTTAPDGRPVVAPPAASPSASGPGVFVSGNQLVDRDGRPVILRGVNRSGSEYACIDGWGVFDGPADRDSVSAMEAWGVNAVRVPLNSACWLDVREQFATHRPAFAGDRYRAAIKDYVDLLTRQGLYAVVELHWSGCGESPCLANWLKPMPDRPYAAQFWSSVAAEFAGNASVLFDLFNEPHDVDWSCWKSGGCTVFADDADNAYQAEGMQSLIDAVRSAGASTQPILLGGLGYANDMRGWLENLPVDPSDSLVASVHLYDFNYPCPLAVDQTASGASAISCFSEGGINSIAGIAAEHPVVFGELGQGECRGDFVAPVLRWLGDRNHGVFGWAWNVADCADFPALISDYDGTATAFGEPFRDFFLSQVD